MTSNKTIKNRPLCGLDSLRSPVLAALPSPRTSHMERLRDLQGLGPKSEAWLHEVGINSVDELRTIGAVRAFIRLRKDCSTKPSLNFLYAMVGALEGEHWLTIAKHEKGRLLMELEGYRELEEMLRAEGLSIEI